MVRGSTARYEEEARPDAMPANTCAPAPRTNKNNGLSPRRPKNDTIKKESRTWRRLSGGIVTEAGDANIGGSGHSIAGAVVAGWRRWTCMRAATVRAAGATAAAAK